MGTGTGTGTYWFEDPPGDPEEEDCSDDDDDDDEELDSAELLVANSKTNDNIRFNVKAMAGAVEREAGNDASERREEQDWCVK